MDDQTAPAWLEDISEEEKGTGVFIAFRNVGFDFTKEMYILAVQSRRYEEPLLKTILSELTYSGCLERGNRNGVLAFKWVPQKLASFYEIVGQAADCGKDECNGRCDIYGCECIGNECL